MIHRPPSNNAAARTASITRPKSIVSTASVRLWTRLAMSGASQVPDRKSSDGDVPCRRGDAALPSRVRRRRGPEANQVISAHHHSFFKGHEIRERCWPVGPIESRLPGFYVHEVGPGPRLQGWTYLSVGLWSAVHGVDGHGLEFLLSAPQRDDRLVELMTMVGYYHAGPSTQHLDLGHTMPIGEPWLPHSQCDNYVVSLPYLYGPDLETCNWEDGHARHLWLLPITQAELDFKVANGLETLEQRFDEAAILPTDPLRESVV